MAPLLNIPLEVLLLITSHLTTPEYGNLRATCRHIEASLFTSFSKEFFSKRQFALMEFSIQALVDIAKSRLGPSLTHLIIHLEHPEVSFLPRYRHINNDDLAGDAAAHNRILAQSLAHAVFISTGRDFEMLSEAIRHLPNLETIGMRDFHSNSRTRDNTEWHSYGCPTLRATTRARLGLPIDERLMNRYFRTSEYTNHVFLTILRAMGNSAASGHNPRLTRLEVLLHHCSLPDQAFMIPRYFDAEISAALHKLTSILLDGLTNAFPDSVFVSNVDPACECGYFLSRFLVKVPALKHLRLNFKKYHLEAAEKVLLWLASTATDTSPNHTDSLAALDKPSPLPSIFPPPPRLEGLKYLDIGMVTVKESTLFTLYSKFKSTLRTISLHKTTLYYDSGPRGNGLASLCQKLALHGFELTEVKLSYLQQRIGPRHAMVTFKESRNQSVKIWRGGAFSQAVQDITRDIQMSWYSSPDNDEVQSDGLDFLTEDDEEDESSDE